MAVATGLETMLSGFIELAILAGVALYAGLVLMSYWTDGPHVHVRFDLKDPAPSAERLAVWLGVKALAFMVWIATPLFGMLSEASAEVGEWYLSRRDPQTQEAIRSRFV